MGRQDAGCGLWPGGSPKLAEVSDGTIERPVVLGIEYPDKEPNNIDLWFELAGYLPGGKPCRPLHDINLGMAKEVVIRRQGGVHGLDDIQPTRSADICGLSAEVR